MGGQCLHPRPCASSSRTEFRLSARHHHTRRRSGEFERLRRRLDLVRCRLGRQSWLGLRQLLVLRLPEPPRSRDRVWSAARHRHCGIQSRRLLGPLLRRSTVVRATRLLDAQAGAAASTAPAAAATTTPGATESAAATSSPATPTEAAGDAPTRAAKPASPPESRQGSQARASRHATRNAAACAGSSACLAAFDGAYRRPRNIGVSRHAMIECVVCATMRTTQSGAHQ